MPISTHLNRFKHITYIMLNTNWIGLHPHEQLAKGRALAPPLPYRLAGMNRICRQKTAFLAKFRGGTPFDRFPFPVDQIPFPFPQWGQALRREG